jgi:hypothetical protein
MKIKLFCHCSLFPPGRAKNVSAPLYYLSEQYSSVFQIFSFVHRYHGTRLWGKHKVTPQINEVMLNTDLPEPIAETTIQQMWHNANCFTA